MRQLYLEWINRSLKTSEGMSNPCARKKYLLEQKKEWFELHSDLETRKYADIFDDYIKDAREECASFKNTTDPGETKSMRIKDALLKHGLFEIEKTRGLSAAGKTALMHLIISNQLPYRIALLDNIGFFQHLYAERFSSKREAHKAISKWFESDSDGRSVRGNIDSLVKPSDRYTAYQHKEKAQKDYQALK